MPFRVFRALLCLTLALLFACSLRADWVQSPEEAELSRLLTRASGQRRPFMVLDPILSQVARERAADLAKRDYFDHINPDGHGVNYLVRKAGYILPSFYPGDGNNLESIAGGAPNAAGAWSDWMGSPSHKTHLLAEQSFFTDQTSYGVGYYADPVSEFRYYWVVLTAPPNPVRSSLTIATPSVDAEVPEGAVQVSGSTFGTPPAASVEVRLENARSTTSFRPVFGTTNWSGTLASVWPGRNTITVRSIAADGSVLNEVTRSFRYVMLRPLTVSVVGEGTVGGFTGTTLRELTKIYRIRATPAAGWLFAGWTGSWTGTDSVAAVTMRSGLAATATFVPNPFLATQGAYRGLIGGADAGHAMRGLLEMQVTSLGSLSGRLVFAGKSYALSGGFNLSGRAVFDFPQPDGAALRLKVALGLDAAAGHVTGFLKMGDVQLDLSIPRAPGDSTNFSALAGRYTLAFPASVEAVNPALPKGDGYAVAVVEPSGEVTITGALADGTALSRKTWISAEASIPLYVPMDRGRGSLSGTLQFANQEASDLAGVLRWTRPRRDSDLQKNRAFAADLAAIGCSFRAPASGEAVIVVPAGEDNAALTFGEGNLAVPVVQPASFLPDNTVAVTAPALPGLSLTLNPSNGRMNGSFTHPVTRATTSLRGVILQKQNLGVGYFLNQDQSGYVTFAPAQ